ncbi:hypothetical protein I79_011764 [Cricetulus griseus]|uniref:Uncharacterized protein n=1 Tax=Cricetulus griseus TaxID=10029 RepID=G3HM20_CRIGR|nr:hypothetical protein I79_011764 [Cricetulus griseus]
MKQLSIKTPGQWQMTVGIPRINSRSFSTQIARTSSSLSRENFLRRTPLFGVSDS